MVQKFRPPDFTKGDLEFRYEHGVVCIYGTTEGLKYLAESIADLIRHPNRGHIHLEEDITRSLTPKSERGAIAIFSRGNK